MKLLSRTGLSADHYRISATVFGAFCLVGVFQFTQPVDLQRHNAFLSYISQLQNDDARLGEAVLELNFSLSNNYDNVTAIIRHMHTVAKALRDESALVGLHDDAEFRQQMELLEKRLPEKQDALERFKSKNAVLKNSLLYLPEARSELQRSIPPGSPAHEYLDHLVMQVLIKRVQGASLLGEYGADVAALQRYKPGFSVLVRSRIDRLLHHVRLIDQFESEMPALIQRLSGDGGTDGLESAYQHYYEQQQSRAAEFRLFLLLATLALLVYATMIFRRLRENARHLRLAASVFANASDGITITDTSGAILDVNPSFLKVTGYSREEVLGKNPSLLKSGRQDADFYARMWQSINETGQWQGEIWNRRKNGEVYPEWLTISSVTQEGGAVSHYIGSFVDITQRKHSEAEIHYLAFYDPLTKLANRRLLVERINHVLALGNRESTHSALLFIDLDYFKTLNDTKGHDVGDMLLIEVSERLKTAVREADTVSRLGGDEFIVLVENLDKDRAQAAAQALMVGEKIQNALKQPYHLRDFEYHTTCSIGVSLFGIDAGVDDLLKRADTAMYEAKNAGRDTLRFFDPAMQSALEARVALEDDLYQALAMEQFRLFYQVQVDAAGKPVGAEALVRWQHPERGLVPPGNFIPLAEDTGLILPIGFWVLEAACKQLKEWEADPLTKDLKLAINVSVRQFASPGFISQVQMLINSTGIDPGKLKLEITESIMLENVDRIIETMRQLKSLGVSFSMDDFGTGYSSLQYIKQLPLDQLKIDQSFVRHITSDSNDKVIVRTIIAMADSMHIKTIAEGVETDEQRKLLAEIGCVNYQGYLFSKPVPLDQFVALVRQA